MSVRALLCAIVFLCVVCAAAGPGHAQQPAPSGESAARPTAGPAVDENDDNDNARRRARVNATAKLELAAGIVTVVYPLLPADGPDAAAIATLDDGEVLELTRSMALKLKTEVELRFEGGAVARPGNVSPGYPGVYSLWLRRAGEGFRLVLNREPDIWGTMRDPAADVGETPIVHQRLAEADRKKTLEATLDATNGGGELSIRWGTDRWIAHFDAGAGMKSVEAGTGGGP